MFHGKGKSHTFDIAPLSEGTSLQKRSGMARVVERFYSFICTTTNGISHACLSLAKVGSDLPTLGGMEG